MRSEPMPVIKKSNALTPLITTTKSPTQALGQNQPASNNSMAITTNTTPKAMATRKPYKLQLT